MSCSITSIDVHHHRSVSGNQEQREKSRPYEILRSIQTLFFLSIYHYRPRLNEKWLLINMDTKKKNSAIKRKNFEWKKNFKTWKFQSYKISWLKRDHMGNIFTYNMSIFYKLKCSEISEQTNTGHYIELSDEVMTPEKIIHRAHRTSVFSLSSWMEWVLNPFHYYPSKLEKWIWNKYDDEKIAVTKRKNRTHKTLMKLIFLWVFN